MIPLDPFFLLNKAPRKAVQAFRPALSYIRSSPVFLAAVAEGFLVTKPFYPWLIGRSGSILLTLRSFLWSMSFQSRVVLELHYHKSYCGTGRINAIHELVSAVIEWNKYNKQA